MTDRVSLRALEVTTLIGVHDWEQEAPQKLLVDVELSVDCAAAGDSDQLQDALDYEQVAASIISFATDKHFQLLERFATALADFLLARFKPEQVKVEVIKSCAKPAPFSAVVSITRSKT